VARPTFLFDEHVKLGGKMVDFMGWKLPVQYEGILAEHDQCRNSACLFDTGHMGQIHLAGEHAAEDLSKVLTQNARALPVGRSKYGLMLHEDGGIMDDTILMRLGPYEFLLVVNAGPLIDDLRRVLQHCSSDTRVVDQTQTWAKLDLQGPAAFAVLDDLVDIDLSGLGYFSATPGNICDLRCVISRTGYTGELGYEIFIPLQNAVGVWRALVGDDRVKPAGLGARDLLRLEMCYPLYGQDATRETTPLEADLDGFIKLDHDFIGAEALEQRMARGAEKKLVAFVGDSRRRPPQHAEIHHKGQRVGEVTSGAYSPSLGCSIGMGYVPTELAEPGNEMTIVTDRFELEITLAQKPLYRDGTCRAKKLRSLFQ
jgi:aminomethyltransferase